MKYLKVTISGSFKDAANSIESFDGVTGIIPALPEAKANQQIIRRYARMWLLNSKDSEGNGLYKNMKKVRDVYIDSIEDCEDDSFTFSYIGKQIIDMTPEELQDLAAANDLQEVPLFRVGGLTTARRVAFALYATKALGWSDELPSGERVPVNWRREGFSTAAYPRVVADGEIRINDSAPVNIEAAIDMEAVGIKKAPSTSSDAAPQLTLDQLKAIAKSKNITFHPSIGYDALYKRLYVEAAA